MKKQTNKKLSFSTETLRTLPAGDLELVGGGQTTAITCGCSAQRCTTAPNCGLSAACTTGPLCG